MLSSLTDRSLVERKRTVSTVEQYPIIPKEGGDNSMAGAIFTRSEVFEYDLIPSDPKARSGGFLPPHLVQKQKEAAQEAEVKVLPIEYEQSASTGYESKLSGNTFRDRPNAMPRADMSPIMDESNFDSVVNPVNNTVTMQRWQAEIEDTWDSSVSLETLMRKHPSNWQDIRRLLRIEKLDVDTLKRYGVRGLSTLDGLMLPRYQHSRLDRNPLKPSGLKVIKLIHGMRQTLETEIYPDDGSFCGFFGWHMVNPEDREITVVSDELDAMALWQSSNRRLTIAIPTDFWEDGIDLQVIPYLEDFDRVHIWFPEDQLEKARRYGLDLPGVRTALVMKDDDRDPVKSGPMRMLRQGRNNEIRLALKESTKEFLPAIRSKEMLTPEQLRGYARDELFNHTKVSKGLAQWIRFKPLNSYLLGFRSGELTVLSGRTGIGKTTFLCEYTVDLMAQGVRTLFCTLEVPVKRIYKCMLQQLARSPLYKAAERLNAERTMDKFERMGLVYFFDRDVFDNLMGKDYPIKVIDALRSYIRLNGINHLVIDNLQFIVGQAQLSLSELASGSQTMDGDVMQDLFVQKFRHLSTETKAHITMVVHPKKETDEKLGLHSLYGGPRVTQEADTVLIIQKSETGNKKYLQIAKNRFGGERVEDERLELKFQKDTLCHSMMDRLATTTNNANTK